MLATKVKIKNKLHLVPAADDVKRQALLNQSAYQVTVVKFGGNAINDEKVLDGLIDNAIALASAGVKVVVVHGGGSAVNEALSKIGKQSQKVNGLRVTDGETLEIAVKVFAEINEKLVQKFEAKNAKALGFCSQAAIPFISEKMKSVQTECGDVDLGFVGKIVDVDALSIERWMWAGYIPVVSPIGIGDGDGDKQLYNINADHAALALASQLQADGLYFMTDVPGLLNDCNDFNTRIKHVTPLLAQCLIEDGTVSGGMLPKVKSCIAALSNGISRIAIFNSFEPNALVDGFLNPQSVGTLITGESHAK